MELVRIFRQAAARVLRRERRLVRLDAVLPAERLDGLLRRAHGRGGHVVVFVEQLGLHRAAHGQRHGRGRSRVHLLHLDGAGGDAREHVSQGVQVQVVPLAGAQRLADEGVLRLLREGGELLLPAHALHPQRLAAAAAHAHHQRAGAGIAEVHGEQGRPRQQGAHALRRAARVQALQKALRQRLAAHGVEQEPVVVLKGQNVLPR